MNRKVLLTLTVTLVACISTMGAACDKLKDVNPITPACKNVAETLAVCGYATYGSFTIFEEQGLKIAADPALPQSARDAIIAADEVAKPVADSLYDALLQYESISAEVAAGVTTQDKLVIATANLNQWVTEAAPLIRNLVTAVTSARGSK